MAEHRVWRYSHIKRASAR